MDILYGGLPAWAFWLACAVTFAAGFVKGAIGFAMPLIMVAAFSSFMPPETALAALILSVLTTNMHQSLREGWRAAWDTVRRYWRVLAATALGIVISAPFVVILPQRLMLGLLGAPVMAFALMQLAGWQPVIAQHWRNRAEILSGLVGGLYGGISGIWGPPLIVYLLAIRTPKAEAVRVQGVVFLLGSVVLTFAHLGTGVLNAATIPLSAALVVPAWAGMLMGFRMLDRLDPVRFRWWTLVVLFAVALNLLRRAVFG